MAREEEDDDDGFFQEVYGQGYTGPLQREQQRGSPAAAAPKRKADDSDQEEPRARDPHEIPTEFTSREGKFWDAKAKALERAWKKKKEEELMCRICGETGHFSQGCPSTLGGGGPRAGEVVERLLLRDQRLKARIIGTKGSTVQGLQRETGCKIRLEDNLPAGDGSFHAHITGPSKNAVRKALTAVQAIVSQVEKQQQQQGPPSTLCMGPRGGAGARAQRPLPPLAQEGPPPWANGEFRPWHERMDGAGLVPGSLHWTQFPGPYQPHCAENGRPYMEAPTFRNSVGPAAEPQYYLPHEESSGGVHSFGGHAAMDHPAASMAGRDVPLPAHYEHYEQEQPLQQLNGEFHEVYNESCVPHTEAYGHAKWQASVDPRQNDLPYSYSYSYPGHYSSGQGEEAAPAVSGGFYSSQREDGHRE